jgi:phytoene/squalene synthetase
MIRVLGVLTERLSAVLLLPERALRVVVAVLLLPDRADRVADDLPESPAVRERFLLAVLLLYALLLLPERLCVRLL